MNNNFPLDFENFGSYSGTSPLDDETVAFFLAPNPATEVSSKRNSKPAPQTEPKKKKSYATKQPNVGSDKMEKYRCFARLYIEVGSEEMYRMNDPRIWKMEILKQDLYSLASEVLREEISEASANFMRAIYYEIELKLKRLLGIVSIFVTYPKGNSKAEDTMAIIRKQHLSKNGNPTDERIKRLAVTGVQLREITDKDITQNPELRQAAEYICGLVEGYDKNRFISPSKFKTILPKSTERVVRIL